MENSIIIRYNLLKIVGFRCVWSTSGKVNIPLLRVKSINVFQDLSLFLELELIDLSVVYES